MLAIRELTRPGSDHVIALTGLPKCGKTLRLTRVSRDRMHRQTCAPMAAKFASPWVIAAGTADALSKNEAGHS